MTTSEKVAYLKGLAEGYGTDPAPFSSEIGIKKYNVRFGRRGRISSVS